MIKVTKIARSGEIRAEYLNPRYITRIGATPAGETVIEIHGNQFTTWCRESVEEVMAAIDRHSQQGETE